MMRNILIALALLWAAPVFAADAGLKIDGHVQNPATLTVADLKAMPPVTVEVKFDTMHGPEGARWTGVLLADIVKKAQPQNTQRNTALEQVIIARGRDGYGVAIASGEIDPRFAGKQVIVAYEKDGKPMDAIRLMVPGDAHGGRSVTDLVSLTIN